MTLDHLSFGTQDLEATRHFYEAKLGFSVLILEQLLMAEGGRVEHMFIDCGGSNARTTAWKRGHCSISTPMPHSFSTIR